MPEVLVIVEGPTEERFIKDCLTELLSPRNIWIKPILIKPGGGIVSFNRFQGKVAKCLGGGHYQVTSMIDLYGLPDSYPGVTGIASVAPLERGQVVEEALRQTISNPRFRPYVMLHEFEAMLLVDPAVIAEVVAPDDPQLQQQISSGINVEISGEQQPERVNLSSDSAPSKRIQRVISRYNKVAHGPSIVNRIGLQRIRANCRHFNEWVSWLESLTD